MFWAPGAWAETDAIAETRGVPYFTLRNHDDTSDPDTFYGQDRSDLKSGFCHIGQTAFDFLAPVAEAAPFRIPDEFLYVDEVRELPAETIWAQLQQAEGGRAPTLYVHGFFIDFEKGCRRATSFKENTGLWDRFLWFSWPSDGNLLNYARDEVDLYWSVPDIADTIITMEQQFGPGRANLVGHSLGARGMWLALYHLTSVQPDVRVDNVVLLAPDIDFEIFRKLLPHVRGIAKRITIYTSHSDQALAVSAQVHGYPRLGQSGNDVASLDGVEVIDVSDLPIRSPSGHLYHIYAPEVGADLARLLSDGTGAEGRQNLMQKGSNIWALQKKE